MNLKQPNTNPPSDRNRGGLSLRAFDEKCPDHWVTKKTRGNRTSIRKTPRQNFYDLFCASIADFNSLRVDEILSIFSACT